MAAGGYLERSGTNSFCCGVGDAHMWMEEHIGQKVNIDRAEDAVASGADEVAVAWSLLFRDVGRRRPKDRS